MSELDLDAIEARAVKATPGPWGPRLENMPFNILTAAKADAEFLVNAREDVLTLVAEVRRLRPTTADVRKMSSLLFEARELISMFNDMVEIQAGRQDPWSRRVRDEIDAYRAEQGWSPHGFGGETVD